MKKSIISYGILAAAGVLTLGLTSTVANAATTTTTTTFQVTANVQANCIISAAPLAFGTYNGAVNNATSDLSVTCTNTTPYNVGLDKGLGTGANIATRQMTGPNGYTLGYGLYSDGTHTTNWGNTVGTDTVTGTGTGTLQSITVYGQIPAGENVAPGAYADTITATLTY